MCISKVQRPCCAVHVSTPRRPCQRAAPPLRAHPLRHEPVLLRKVGVGAKLNSGHGQAVADGDALRWVAGRGVSGSVGKQGHKRKRAPKAASRPGTPARPRARLDVDGPPDTKLPRAVHAVRDGGRVVPRVRLAGDVEVITGDVRVRCGCERVRKVGVVEGGERVARDQQGVAAVAAVKR